MSQPGNIKADYQRYYKATGSGNRFKRIMLVITDLGFMAVMVFRFCKWTNTLRIPVLGQLARIVYFIFYKIVQVLAGVDIDVNSDIGPGFYIGHFSCVVVTGKLGANCSIGQGVTIGSKGAGKSDGWPVIGDNVYIGAGAKIIGSIAVGDNVVVGANAVVIDNVPANSRAVGVPAKISSLN